MGDVRILRAGEEGEEGGVCEGDISFCNTEERDAERRDGSVWEWMCENTPAELFFLNSI